MVMVRMGSVRILSIKQSVSIDTMINFDVDGDGHGDGTCKQVLSLYNDYSSSVCNYQINWG